MQRSSQEVHQGGRVGEDEPRGHPAAPLDGVRGGRGGPAGASAWAAHPCQAVAPAGSPPGPPPPQLRGVKQLSVPASGARQAVQEGSPRPA